MNKNRNNNRNFKETLSKIAYFVIGLLDIIFEALSAFFKEIVRYVVKEHPVQTILTLIVCLAITIGISFASTRNYLELKNEVNNDEMIIVSTPSLVDKPVYQKVETYYTLGAGDTLYGLACKYSRKGELPSEWMSNVMEMNNISNENRIMRDQEIKIYYWEQLN